MKLTPDTYLYINDTYYKNTWHGTIQEYFDTRDEWNTCWDTAIENSPADYDEYEEKFDGDTYAWLNSYGWEVVRDIFCDATGGNGILFESYDDCLSHLNES